MSEAAAATATDPSGTTVRRMREEDDNSLREWIDGLAGETAVRVQIIRKKPELGPNGENIGGGLETVEEKIDEDYIREHWGGGTFQLKVSRPNGSGNYQYLRARTIKLAGDPKMHGRPLHGPSSHAATVESADSDELTKTVLSTMERTMQSAQEEARAAREGNNGGLDVAMLTALNAPLVAQLEAARAESAELRRLVMDKVGADPPADPFRDKMMEKMVDGESIRLEAMRLRYESEIRQLKDNHVDEIKRIRDQMRDDSKSAERRHERELDMMSKSHDGLLRANDVSYSTRTDGLTSETTRLNRELTEARTEVATLRAKKDQTISEKAEEILKVKEALTGLGGGSDDDSDKPWYERALGAIANSGAAEALVSRIAGGEEDPQLAAQQQQLLEAQAVQQQQAMMPPVGVPFQAPDGNIYMRNADDTVTQIDPDQLRRQRAAAKRGRRRAQPGQAPAEAAGGDEDAPEEVTVEIPEGTEPPSQEDVDMAIAFMEGAIKNNTEPAQFAATARNLVPSPILKYIQAVGVDDFLNKVATLQAGSPLTTQHGRNFAREVVKHLFGGVNE